MPRIIIASTSETTREQLSRLLQERLDVSGEVIRYKEKHGLPILDKAREEEKKRMENTLLKERRYGEAE